MSRYFFDFYGSDPRYFRDQEGLLFTCLEQAKNEARRALAEVCVAEGKCGDAEFRVVVRSETDVLAQFRISCTTEHL